MVKSKATGGDSSDDGPNPGVGPKPPMWVQLENFKNPFVGKRESHTGNRGCPTTGTSPPSGPCVCTHVCHQAAGVLHSQAVDKSSRGYHSFGEGGWQGVRAVDKSSLAGSRRRRQHMYEAH